MNYHDSDKPEPDVTTDVYRLGIAQELVPCAFPILREAAKRWAAVRKAAAEGQELNEGAA